MIAVDASVWVSGLILQDAFHDISRGWLATQHARDNLLAIPVICLAEVSGVISRVTGYSEEGERAIDQIITQSNLRVLPVNHSLGLEAAQLAALLHLRGADAVYVALARRLKIPLATWDQELLQRCGQVISVQQPG